MSKRNVNVNVVEDLKKEIHIKGARSNNLKDIEIRIPKNKLVVVTGLSGSGKSSLIMDTLFAEGQRRYVESLSSYARQFMDRMKKPEVDFIKGICPAIAIEQKVTTSNARSTVGSLTEIYDYLRLFFSRVGRTISPKSGKEVKKHQVQDVIDHILKYKSGTKVRLICPLQTKYLDRSVQQDLDILLQKGYTRVIIKDEMLNIQDILEDTAAKLKALDKKRKHISILIDRFVVNDDLENHKRMADSVLSAFAESEGNCIVDVIDGKQTLFNNRFELDDMVFLEPTHQLFNYNNPYGACPKCEGYGRVLGIDPNKVIPVDTRSIYDGAVACWSGQTYGRWKDQLVYAAEHFKFPIHKPYKDLTQKQKKLLWTGNEYFDGLDAFFEELESKLYKIQNRVMLARYRGRTTCNVCDGGRLRVEATYVKIGKTDITQLIRLPIDELLTWFNKLKLSKHDATIAKRLLVEITSRLEIMVDIGLGYLTLERLSSTLSGGETQRINLTRTLGSNLTNSLYILDEPSIGLHPRDTDKLVQVLKDLRDLGNTVIVVEHEEEMIRNADYIIDVGPQAGIFGGEIVFAGKSNALKSSKIKSLTGDYLYGRKSIDVPEQRRKIINKIQFKNVVQHNLLDIDVTIPLNALTVVTGVSGSGKSTLVRHIVYPALKRNIGESTTVSLGSFGEMEGDISTIKQVELINQFPIGKSSRSNPVTYVKAYDSIRKLMASQQLSKVQGYEPKHFSFNVDGGRCENCQGEGEITIEMQFLADVKLLCDDCKGRRFKQEVIDVKYKDKSISDILNLSIEEAIDFFEEHKDVVDKIKPLYDVGLGYVKLGQSSNTLSGGEAQRVKLASFLGKRNTSGHIFFIFDEPTTGLHFHDIHKLLDALNALVEQGHTVLVVEHNMEVIKTADWIVDLGPGGGKHGGKLMYQGAPEGLIKVKKSHTGAFLKEKL